jgi:hypothetical protein
VSTIQALRGSAAVGRQLSKPVTDRAMDWLLVSGLLTLGVALPVVTGLLAGSLGIPRNDDWVYRRIALELAQTGVLAFHGVTTMMVGQVLIAQPFLRLSGLQPSGFAAAGVMFAAAAVFSSYVLARLFLPPLRAALATSLLLLFPGYLAYATSFMTDVPAVAAQFACLALGAKALRQRPVWNRWLLASAAVGCLAFSIREFAIAAPASVLLGAICAEPRRLRNWAFTIVVIGCCAILYLLKSTVPGQEVGFVVAAGALWQSTYALSSVSLLLLPAALLGGTIWRRDWKIRDIAIGAEIGLLVVGARVLQWLHEGVMPPVVLGNPASQWGTPGIPYLIGGRPILFSDTTWSIVGMLALVATVVVPSVGAGIAGAYLGRSDRSWSTLISRLGSPIGLLVLFSIAVVVGLTLYGLRFALFERYYWSLLPPAATLFMYRPRRYISQTTWASHRWSLALAGPLTAILSVISIVSLVLMLNSFAFDSARWHAGQRLVELGMKPEEIDAGYEWVGYNQPSLPGPNKSPSTQTYYDSLWPGRRSCGIVSSEKEPPPSAPLGTVGYSLYLIAGPEELLYLYRVTSPDCLPA